MAGVRVTYGFALSWRSWLLGVDFRARGTVAVYLGPLLMLLWRDDEEEEWA